MKKLERVVLAEGKFYASLLSAWIETSKYPIQVPATEEVIKLAYHKQVRLVLEVLP